MTGIRVAIVGVGNCASSLVQGIHYYRERQESGPIPGLMHSHIDGYGIADIDIVCAFDIDPRKVGHDVADAIFAPPNCTLKVTDVPRLGAPVHMGPVLDGISLTMADVPDDRRFLVADAAPVDVEATLRQHAVDVMIIYLPVGSQQAAEHYAEAALAAGVAVVNCIPVFLASDPEWAARFTKAGIPILGDDVKSQVGATIVHRALTKLFEDRGTVLRNTYQLNVGGNTDFLNMKDRHRLASKKISKTEAVQSEMRKPMDDAHIHIGPSDYIPWMNDNKVCFVRMEATGFMDVPFELELRLSVQDSPNSAGVVIDAVRLAKLAKDRGIGGPLEGPSAYLFKHPPVQHTDPVARDMVEAFIIGDVLDLGEPRRKGPLPLREPQG